MRKLVEKEFERGGSIPLVRFPEDDTVIQDSPKLTLVLMEPDSEWTGGGELRERVAQWTKQRGRSSRLYPAALVWCLKKPGRELRDKLELWLAWKRVAREVAEGSLGADYDKADRSEIEARVRDAEEAAKDEVWGGYRFVVLADNRESEGLKTIDLGAGHASGAESLCVFLLSKSKAKLLKDGGFAESVPGSAGVTVTQPPSLPPESPLDEGTTEPIVAPQVKTFRLVGTVPPELWNRLGAKLITKLRSGSSLTLGIDFSVNINSELARGMESELRQALEDLGLGSQIRIEEN